MLICGHWVTYSVVCVHRLLGITAPQWFFGKWGASGCRERQDSVKTYEATRDCEGNAFAVLSEFMQEPAPQVFCMALAKVYQYSRTSILIALFYSFFGFFISAMA